MTSRRPQIYLHIGPPKTATTFIQDIIWGNRPVLASQGIHLVGAKGEGHFLAAMDLRRKPLARYEDPRIAGSWDNLAAAAHRVKSGKALISHEYFAAANAEHIARLTADLEGADLHIVYTARDLGRQLPAVWQETLKNRSTLTFDLFLDHTLDPDRSKRRPHHFWAAHDTLAVLERWSVASSPERVHVLTAPAPGATSPDLWSRFATAVGADTDELDMSVARSNTSLSRAEAEVLRMVNAALPEDLPWPSYQRLVKRRFNQVANQQQPRGDRIRVPHRYREMVLEESARTQKGLAEAGYHLIGDLSDLEVPDNAFGSNDPLPAEQIADAATGLLAHVLTKPVMQGHKATAETPAERRRRRARDVYHRTQAKVRRLLPRR